MDLSGKAKALILNIQRMSTEDGPGIRTTIFFKGCSLSCAWCHNPESISGHKEIQWIETRCIGCKNCVKVCKNEALIPEKKGIKIDRDKCKRCFTCATECPGLALEIKGEDSELQGLLKEALKDKAYFEKSQGGITVSGGEPLLQYQFVSEFLRNLKESGIHTAIDTCGMCNPKALEYVLPYTDLVLYDLKLIDSELHKRYTGWGNDVILQNLLVIGEMMRRDNTPRELWIRTPVIPGATADDENIRKIGEFIAKNLNDVVSRWDLCAFNNLCRDKYRRLDMEWAFEDTKLLSRDEMEHKVKTAGDTGVNPEIVHWSGATRIDE